MQANDASAKARQAPERRAGEGRRCGLASTCEPIMRRLPIFASKVTPRIRLSMRSIPTPRTAPRRSRDFGRNLNRSSLFGFHDESISGRGWLEFAGIDRVSASFADVQDDVAPRLAT